MTPSEKFVSELCQKSFLPFWSFPNPIGNNGKELCDILVICDPDIIIFSVKDISIKESGNNEVDIERWLRRAIDGSVNQIYGAERIIGLKEEILLKDRQTKIPLPTKGIRNIYRVAVAFGRGKKFPVLYGDFGKGFVHVHDERSIGILLRELDTITDFVDYLKAKEKFIRSGVKIAGNGGEDLLAFYFQNGFDVPANAYIILDDGLWDSYIKTKEYNEWVALNHESYFWDNLISEMYGFYEAGTLISESNREMLEESFRVMNKEPRISRREISSHMIKFIKDCNASSKTGARIIKPDIMGSPTYIIQNTKFNDRKERLHYLTLRCMVAKGIYKDSTEIVGIAMDIGNPDGISYDICYMELKEFDDKLRMEIKSIVDEFGFFKAHYELVKRK